MNRRGLRARLIVAAVLPAVLVALSLATVLVDRQYSGLDEALRARARAEARQVAGAAEFDVFAGSRDGLRALVKAAQTGDADILAVTIFDVRGAALATSGTSALRAVNVASWEEQVTTNAGVTTVFTPIRRSRLPVDDIYSGNESPGDKVDVDGFVVLEMSRARLDAGRNRQLLIDAAVTLVGLLLATALALRIAGGVTRPILRIGDVVERIGQGNLSARVEADTEEVMTSLEDGINQMAERIGQAQEYLVQQISAATAEMRERKEEAERANAAKTRFLAAASHDLRQPMHALGLFVSRLEQVPNTPEARPLVANVNASVLALQDLLEALLDISRLDAGLVTACATHFPLADLLARLRLEFEGTAQARQLRLHVRDSDAWLTTDPQLLGRILMNLVSNALRYTRRGGVLVGCRRRRGKVLIEVWDSGIGIEAVHLHEIFKEYVQVANPERNRDKGLGLGLAICDRLAELLQLPMGVRSVLGRGSVFWIEVPLGEPQAPAVDDTPSPASMAGTIAVISNATSAVAGLLELVAGWGCRTVQADSVDSLLLQCEEVQIVPDVAICDLPSDRGEEGIAAGLALRRRFGALPVLLLSADISDKLVIGAARRDFALLGKPVRPGKLRALLQHLLAQQRITRTGPPEGGDGAPGGGDAGAV